MQNPIYFDHAATTPLDRRVLEEMMPWFTEHHGNASSVHQVGQTAKVALEEARESVAAILNVKPSEVIFTSGGTESNNAAIKGVYFAAISQDKNRTEIVTSEAEHNAVRQTVEALKDHGATVIFLQPGPDGRISPQQVADAVGEHTALVSIMHVNNELGTVNPIGDIADVCREQGVPFHSDCVQSAGKIPLDLGRAGPDLASLSGHKFYGPKGTGVLVAREGVEWVPWMHGGSQERGRRGGTSNVPGIVGLRKALELAREQMDADHAHCQAMRARVLEQLNKKFPGQYQLNTPSEVAIPHILNLRFSPSPDQTFDGEMLLLNLDIEGVCVSNGSACTSGAVEPSHVLTAIGLESPLANASVRISFGRGNRLEEADQFVEKLERVLKRMSNLNQSTT